MTNRNILISGAGIAGLTLAYYLKKYGFNPTIVEIAPELRQGGYMIDFWGVGFDVAERMGILPDLEKAHYHIPELIFVDDKNRKKGTFSIARLRKLIGYRHYNLLRSSVANILYDRTRDACDFIFGQSISGITQSESGVSVTFSDGSRRTFDLLIGTDGLHSNVRNQVFGSEDQFSKYLGYYTASFTIDNYTGKDDTFLSFSAPGKQVGIYSIAENKMATFFIFRSGDMFRYDSHDTGEQKRILSKAFQDVGWECPTLLQKMHPASDFYFDSVSQITMNEWSRGRVSLGGDACQCVSLIAGQGSALAMAGMYVLAGELRDAHGDHITAFKKYEHIMKGEIARKQTMAQKFAGSFVPDSAFGIWARNTFSNLMFLPGLSKWFINQFLSDSLDLKKYERHMTAVEVS